MLGRLLNQNHVKLREVGFYLLGGEECFSREQLIEGIQSFISIQQNLVDEFTLQCPLASKTINLDALTPAI